MPLHRGPLADNDAVNAGVAQGAVGSPLVIAQHPIQLGAQPFNGAPAPVVKEMGAKLYRYAIQRFEGMGEQHQFALGVDRGPLHALSIPGAADFYTFVLRVDVHVGRHAHWLARGVEDHGKRQHRALLLQV